MHQMTQNEMHRIELVNQWVSLLPPSQSARHDVNRESGKNTEYGVPSPALS